MSGQKTIKEMSFGELEQAIKDIEKQALLKIQEEYPDGVMLVFSHGLEERKAIVCGYSEHELKIRVHGKTGKYWIDTHRIIKAVCPKCESEDWHSTSAAHTFAYPETYYELCHSCDYQWGHR